MLSDMTQGPGVGTVLLVLALMGTLAALQMPNRWFEGIRAGVLARAGWQADSKRTWKTDYGPLTAMDRDFIGRCAPRHDAVLSFVGLVRDQIRNSMVRLLATRANAVVLDPQLSRGTGLLVSRR